MVTKNKVGRPAKTFKPKPKPVIIRGRGRPRKYGEDQQDLKLEEIKNMPISFVQNRIRKNSKIDNIALGLLVFSILLFIFSLLFKGKQGDSIEVTTQQNKTPIVKETTPKITDTHVIQNTGTQIIAVPENNTKPLTVQEELLSDFYKSINEKKIDNLVNLIDIPLKQSSAYKTYYNTTRLKNFIDNISNNTIYITDIKEIANPGAKSKKYQYTLKYKLKSDNTLFVEERNANIVYKNNKNLIGSIMCINKGCSLNPFFNPTKYGIK